MQIPNLNYGFLKERVLSYFPGKEISLVVPKEDQEQEILSLKETLGSKRFFFVVNLLNFEIQEMHGIEKWLGYSERDFSLRKYWDIISEGRQNWLMLVALQLYDSLCTGKYPLKFMVQRFGSRIPIRHYNGKELLVIKTASVFQYDDKNRLTAYLNEFTIIGDYNGEPLTTDFYSSTGEQKTIEAAQIMQQVIQHFIDMRVFARQEMRIARLFVYHPEITQTKIAVMLKLKYTTIRTHCRRFLEKARDFFQQDFRSPREAALFLHKEGLL